MKNKAQRLNKVKKELAIIKNQKQKIKEAFELYKEAYPEYSDDAVCTMIGDETDKDRATIWRIVGGSAYKDKGIITF